jgi:hypothetical protein
MVSIGYTLWVTIFYSSRREIIIRVYFSGYLLSSVFLVPGCFLFWVPVWFLFWYLPGYCFGYLFWFLDWYLVVNLYLDVYRICWLNGAFRNRKMVWFWVDFSCTVSPILGHFEGTVQKVKTWKRTLCKGFSDLETDKITLWGEMTLYPEGAKRVSRERAYAITPWLPIAGLLSG